MALSGISGIVDSSCNGAANIVGASKGAGGGKKSGGGGKGQLAQALMGMISQAMGGGGAGGQG